MGNFKTASLAEALAIVAERVGDQELAKEQLTVAFNRGELPLWAEELRTIWRGPASRYVPSHTGVEVDKQINHPLYPEVCRQLKIDWQRSSAKTQPREWKHNSAYKTVEEEADDVYVYRDRLDELWPNSRSGSASVEASHRSLGGDQGTDKPKQSISRPKLDEKLTSFLNSEINSGRPFPTKSAVEKVAMAAGATRAQGREWYDDPRNVPREHRYAVGKKPPRVSR